MEKKFRLKKEACPFFKDELKTNVLPLYVWNEKYHVDLSALEEVENCHVLYGIDHNSHKELAGWSAEHNPDKGSRFYFTLVFPSMTNREYQILSNGGSVRELMDKIQDYANSWWKDISNE